MAENYSQSGMSPVGQLTSQDRVGPYVVVQPVATESYATSYTGRDPIINRSVLIQQIHLTGSAEDKSIRQRVKDVAIKTRDITTSHANAWAPILDVFDEPRGVFVVHDWVEGQSLAELLLLDPLPMPVRKVLGIVAATAAALKPLHQAGLAHADLEPKNVLMTSNGGLQLTNAGIAAAADEQYALNMPTAAYMAPEILKGEEVDGRADLYAIGMMAYRMLLGEEKFNDAFKVVVRDQRNQAMRWMKWHTNPRTNAQALYEISPPSSEQADAMRETATANGVPEGVSAIVMRLMQKSPSARFANVDELLEAIRRYFSGDTIATASAQDGPSRATAAATLSEPGHTAKLPQRRNPLMTALAVMLGTWIILAVIIGGTLYNRQRHAQNEHYEAMLTTLKAAQTEMESGRYSDAQRLYQQVADAYEPNTRFGRISRAGILRAQGDALMVAKEYFDARMAYLDLEKLDYFDEDKVRSWIAEAEEALAFQQGAQAIRSAIRAGDFADARERLGRWDRLVTTWSAFRNNTDERDELARLQAELRQNVTAETVEQQLARGTSLWTSGRRDEAVTHLSLALDVRPDDEQLQNLYLQYSTQENYDAFIRQADAARAAGNPNQAVEAYIQANQLARQFSDASWFESQPQVTRKLQETRMEQAFFEGNKALEIGDVDEARNYFESSVAIARTLGLDAQNTPAQRALNDIDANAQLSEIIAQAEQAMNDSDYQQAQTLFRLALSIQSTPEVSQRLEDARFSFALQKGLASLREGKLDDAEAQFQRAGQIRPGDSTVERGISELRTQRAFSKLMDEAQAARESSQYGLAKRIVKEAEQLAVDSDGVIDPEPVALLGDQIEYEHLMALAMGYYEAKQYRLSHASLRGAMELRNTDEARALLERLEPFLVGVIEDPDDIESGTPGTRGSTNGDDSFFNE